MGWAIATADERLFADEVSIRLNPAETAVQPLVFACEALCNFEHLILGTGYKDPENSLAGNLHARAERHDTLECSIFRMFLAIAPYESFCAAPIDS